MSSFSDLCRKLCAIPSIENDQDKSKVNALLDNLIVLVASSEGGDAICERLVVHCCSLIGPTNEQLCVKSATLVSKVLTKTKIVLSEASVQCCVKRLIEWVNRCGVWIHADILCALSAVLYDNGGMLGELYPSLLDKGRGILWCAVHNPMTDVDVRRSAIQCLEHLCRRCTPYLSDEYASVCLKLLIQTLQSRSPEPQSTSETHGVDMCRIYVSALRGLEYILVYSRGLHMEYLGDLLAIFKAYSFWGTPTQTLDTACLQPSAAPPGIKLPVALPPPRPSSASTTATGGGKRRSKWKKQRDAAAATGQSSPRRGGASNRGDDDEGRQLQTSGQSVLGLSFYSSVSSSEGEFSECESSGGGRWLQSCQSRVRQSSLVALHAIIKATDKLSMFGFWTHFLPENGTSPNTLVSVITMDSSYKARTAAAAALSVLLEGSKKFLTLATEGLDHRKSKPIPFTPFSALLANIVKEVHAALFYAIPKEQSLLTNVQLIKCLANLIGNSPYQKLRPGLLSKSLRTIKPFLSHRDPNTRVACLTCIGAMLTIHAPLLEVCHMMSPLRTPSTQGSDSPQLLAPETPPQPLSPTGDSSKKEEPNFGSSAEGKSVARQLGDMVEDLDINASLLHAEKEANSSVNFQKDEDPLSSNPCTPRSGSYPPLLDASGESTPLIGHHPSMGGASGSSSPRVGLATGISPAVKETPWALKMAVQIVKGTRDPLPVKVEALQMLRQMVTGYFPLIRWSLPVLADLIAFTLKESRDINKENIQFHSAKLLADVGQTMLKVFREDRPHARLTPDEGVTFWSGLLYDPLPQALQDTSNSVLCVTVCEALSCIGPGIFESLQADRRAMVLTVLLGLAVDGGPGGDKSIQAEASRALGVFVLDPTLREDVSFVADVSNSVVSCMESGGLPMRIKAAWSLANITYALVLNLSSPTCEEFLNDFSSVLLLRLFATARRTSEDNDKVRCNGMRALGNLLRFIQPIFIESGKFDGVIEQSVGTLVKHLQQGAMKVRWNSCYALGSVLKNESLPLNQAPWIERVLSSLALQMKSCKNFKVRINAASALTAPGSREVYGRPSFYASMWREVIGSMEEGDSTEDFAEYRYKETLASALSLAVLRLALFITPADLVSVGPVLFSKEPTLKLNLRDYIAKQPSQAKEDGPKKSESDEETPVVVDRRAELARVCVHLTEVKGQTLTSEQQSVVSTLIGVFTAEDQVAEWVYTLPKTSFRGVYD